MRTRNAARRPSNAHSAARPRGPSKDDDAAGATTAFVIDFIEKVRTSATARFSAGDQRKSASSIFGIARRYPIFQGELVSTLPLARVRGGSDFSPASQFTDRVDVVVPRHCNVRFYVEWETFIVAARLRSRARRSALPISTMRYSRSVAR